VGQEIKEGRKISAFAQKPLKIQKSLTENIPASASDQDIKSYFALKLSLPFAVRLLAAQRGKVQVDAWLGWFWC